MAERPLKLRRWRTFQAGSLTAVSLVLSRSAPLPRTFSLPATCPEHHNALLRPQHRHKRWLRAPELPPAAAIAARASAAAAAAPAEIKLSSVPQSTVNLVKNIVGAGMLTLPSGVAAFSSSPQALVPSLVMTVVFGLLSAYGFVLIADACGRTEESTYWGAWAKAVSPGTAWLPLMACFAKAAIGCISFSMILGDCLSLILTPLDLPALLAGRGSVMVLFTALVLLPLCSLKSLAPLAKFSALGVLSNVYICGFIVLRCLDGSYGRGGALLAAAPAAPAFGTFTGWSAMMNPSVAVLLSMLATAFLAHYNAPMFYEQLAPSQGGEKYGRFVFVSMLGFTAAALIYSIVTVGGFLTFGTSCSGLILNNYASSDGLAALARVAIAISLSTAYPIVFFSFRNLFLEVSGDLGRNFAAARPAALNIMLLSLITAVACKLTNLGTLAAFAGACFGTFLIYVAPALMVLSAERRGLGAASSGGSGRLARAVQLALIPVGLVLAMVGCVQSLK